MADPKFDEEAIQAAVNLIGRSGARHFEVGYLYDETEPEYVTKGACWWAKAQHNNGVILTEDHPDPVTAAEALAVEVLTGARCLCGRLVALREDGAVFRGDTQTMADGTTWTAEEAAAAGQCRWRRIGPKWESGCTPDPNSARGRLALALEVAGAPPEMVHVARNGYYDDFLSPLAMPLMQLVADARRHGLDDIAERTANGEFDSTVEESKAWAESEEGRAAFAELTAGAAAAARGGPRPKRAERRRQEREDRRRKR